MPTTRVDDRLRGLPWRWNATPEEFSATYPCDRLLDEAFVPLVRAVDVAAPVEIVYRWLCQLRVAPYSYDWIDNRGRPSPRKLTPGLGDLAIGQTFQVMTITSYMWGEHITGRATATARRLFGLLSLSYAVWPLGDGRSRLLVRLDVRRAGSLRERARFAALAWGDVIMMRRQLLNLKALAEHTWA
jgi:hypothetical protein